MPALLQGRLWGGIDFTGVQTVAGAGVSTKLIPELVELKPVRDTLPKLVHARAEALASRRLRVNALGGGSHWWFEQ